MGNFITGDKVYLIGDKVTGPFDSDTAGDTPVVQIKWPEHDFERVKAYPVQDPPAGCTPWMFGGNFIYTSDSRFPAEYPIPLHDRTETWEMNERMSR